MVTVFSSPSCAPCRVAKTRLDAAGIPFVDVDLSTNPEQLANLKSRTDREFIQTPLFEFNGELRDMTGLRELIEEASTSGEPE